MPWLEKLNINPNTARQSEADIYNEQDGELTDYECNACRNKGFIAHMDGNTMLVTRCKCHEARKTIKQMRRSGVDAEKTFDNYVAKTTWQKDILKTAKAFIDTQGSWLYAGGQVGAGKTHICTAAVNEFISKGYQCMYMLWKDESTKLKASINDTEKYADMLDRYKTCAVLYIDDFLKTRPNESPSAGDLNLAFELLNYRYNNKKLITIISSERFVEEISLIDEAIGSRIVERSAGYCLNVKRDMARNYRLIDFD